MIVLMAERPLEHRMVERLQRWYHRNDPPPQKPPERISYGRLSYANRAPRVIVYPGDPEAKIQVGNYTSIAADVEFIVGGNHRTDWVSSFPFRHILDMPGYEQDGHPASNDPIVVGSDVWIGRSALIVSGVSIGDGAVVAAGSVVARDVEPYTIVGGSPARPLKRRFSPDASARLLEIRWWDWPEAEVLEVVPLLNGATLDEFFEYCEHRQAPAVGNGAPDIT